eukprot:CAMPEP_0180123928 /NCGR_PEP_ID=MMETSP0986-20121125/4373_1 /TAXON_ID=697907 /ORGANISM="non described non described, Strain CCMP2293" /LENGTH=354 /DNA_ID=CAMNT_0022063221 /DNA_START=531 /DNA_END=1592 /DNA_ORIENTATION=-
MAPLPKATLLFFLFFLLLVEPVSPHGIVGEGLRRVGRHLLQTVDNPSPGSDLEMSLCETNICEMQRPDGLCDRWSRSMACPEQEIFRISGAPGSNDKAEMFLNLRSPWGINCSLGRCEPAEGAAYDVFVAEGCIPERDYISEMQDTSARTSKQVKIYLRRNAEFFISIVRRAGIEGASNCSYGLTSGSIEAADSSASCSGFRRLSVAESADGGIPFCRDVMPNYNQYEEPTTGAQSTFVVALIGVGILTLALLVLGAVLVRRMRRREAGKKALDGVDVDEDGETILTPPAGQSNVEQLPTEPALDLVVPGSAERGGRLAKYGLGLEKSKDRTKERARRAAVGRRLKELDGESDE